MNLPQIPIPTIATFSRVNLVFRAFDHLIAPGIGEVLFVPVSLAEGDLCSVRDGCPMPWEEAWASLDTPVDAALPVHSETLQADWPKLAALFSFGWKIDSIGIGNSAGEQKSIQRLSHVCGLRFVRIKPSSDTPRSC